MATINEMSEHLQNLFRVFNDRFFNGSLIEPIIIIQTNAKATRAKGWCTVHEVWHETSSSKSMYEISISAEYLYLGILDISSTLIHEMVHLYHLQNNVKDVSRGNTYHNTKFKERAEQCGLNIAYDDRIGWSVSTLKPETKDYVSKLLAGKDFNYIKGLKIGIDDSSGVISPIDIPKQQKKKTHIRKYVCPACGISVRASKEVNLICGDCRVHLETDYDE